MSALAVESSNGTGPHAEERDTEDLLDGLELALRARLDQLGAERTQLVEDHKRRLSRLDHEIGRYNRVLKVVNPATPKPGPKKKKATGGTPVSAIIRTAKLILAIEAETFTVRDLNAAGGIKPDSPCYYGPVKRLREAEAIGFARMGANNQRVFQVMPGGREKLEQIANG